MAKISPWRASKKGAMTAGSNINKHRATLYHRHVDGFTNFPIFSQVDIRSISVETEFLSNEKRYLPPLISHNCKDLKLSLENGDLIQREDKD